MTRTTITSTKTGLSATMPTKLAKGLTQEAINTLVFDAYNNHPVSNAVVKQLKIETV